MIRKLKTWEDFKEEFKPLCDKWIEHYNGSVHIEYNNFSWVINKFMKCYFGTKIRIKKQTYLSDYTYRSMKCFWHESWFEPEFEEIEFLSIEEMMI